MCDERTSGHEELWVTSTLPPDQGPEGNLKMWREAEMFFDHLCNLWEKHHNEAVIVGLADVYNRCVEERRRAEDLLELRERWSERRVGGVAEPESPVRGPEGDK